MKTQIKGQFWMVEEPDVKHFGEIHLDQENGEYQLMIFGGFEAFGPALNDFNFHEPIPHLCGFISENKFLLLSGLRVIGGNGAMGIYGVESAFRVTFRLSFTTILQGNSIPAASLLFRTLRFDAQHLATWKDVSLVDRGIHQNTNTDSFMYNPNDHITYTLNGFTPINIPFSLGTCTYILGFDSKRFFAEDEIHAQKKGKISIELNAPMDLGTLKSFMERFREFYSLILGTRAGLEDISVSDTEGQWYQFNYRDNRWSNAYSTSVYAENRILEIDQLVESGTLNSFFQNYDRFRLPLSYFKEYQASRKTSIIRFIQPFVAACSVLYNKLFRIDSEKQGEINRTLADILRTYSFSETHRNFLLESRVTKPIRDIPSWQKLVKLIEASPKLKRFISDPTLFAKRLLDLRNYLVHEDDKSGRDLSLLNDEQKLRRSIVALKIIIEYYLLILAGIDKEIVENKIDRTMPNFVHFQRSLTS